MRSAPPPEGRQADILVVGAGFAGFWAALAARRVAGARASVALLARAPTLDLRPRLYEANPAALAVDIGPALARAGVAFIAGEAGGIDAAEDRVLLAGGETLGYRRLVVATGSVMRRPPIEGAALAHSIDTVADAIAFDRRLAALAAGGRAARLAVVGAGFTGIELVLELPARFAAHGGAPAALDAVLVDRAPLAGAALGPGPQPAIAAALAAAGVGCRLGAGLSSIDRAGLSFADGSRLAADAVVLCTGLVAAPFAATVPGEHDALGRVLVDRTLRSTRAPAVFVGGDAAAADTGDGRVVLQSCQHALQTGRHAGENAARDLLGMPCIEYAQPRYVTCLDLGGAGAVFSEGWSRRVTATGADAKTVKRRINAEVIHPPVDASADELLARSGIDPAVQGRPGLPGSHRARA